MLGMFSLQEKMNIKLDDWQRTFLDTSGDKILCCGRQVGKSVICSIDAGEYAVNNNNKTILMIAPTERQAYALFEKTLFHLADNYPTLIKKGKDRPTKSKIKLKNGTVIWCLPTGLSGIGIRFLTVHRLYADECAYIPEEVFTAITPMLLTTGGDSIYLSTPAGRDGTFAECYLNVNNAYKSFTRFSVSSLDVVQNRPICSTWTEFQRDKAIEYLDRERLRKSILEYAQEYEGALVDELRQFFPTDLIKKCMTIRERGQEVEVLHHHNSSSTLFPGQHYYLGVDVARMGKDESVMVTVREKKRRGYMVDMNVTTKKLLTETARDIIDLDNIYRYKKIFIDDGGLGVGVFDYLLTTSQTRRKIEAINNSSRALTRDGVRQKRLLKEDLYNNLLTMMEQGKIDLLHNDDLFHSLRSIQAEYSGGKLRIFGTYSHITEALIRACWGIRTKGLNIYIH